MSLIKQHLYQLEEEEQELWNSYLEWVGENKELFQQLPKNIKDLLQEEELTYED